MYSHIGRVLNLAPPQCVKHSALQTTESVNISSLRISQFLFSSLIAPYIHTYDFVTVSIRAKDKLVLENMREDKLIKIALDWVIH